MSAITVIATGINITTGAASANAALPPDASGQVPRKVRISVTSAARVRIGTSGLAAIATDLLVQPAAPVVLSIPRGLTHIAAIQDTAAGAVNVTPLEA